jgi:peptidoglycan/LPS O-acetylase OafA/YrhL
MTPSTRWPAVDLLRVVAAHLIVWHHFALYSGMADAAWSLAPQLFAFLVDHARKAVQVFLVLAGFLAAKACMPGGDGPSAGAGAIDSAGAWARAVGGRFMRLAPTLWLALALVVLLDASIGVDGGAPQPSWSERLALVAVNALMLQDVLGMPAPSPGLWYVPIDIQLFALAALLAWWGRSVSARLGAWIVAAAVIASAWIFNRDASSNAWAPYFVAAYGLGMLAWNVGHARAGAAAAMALATIGVLAALAVDFRDRLLLATVVAWVLAVWMRTSNHARTARTTPSSRALAAHADAAYALFLLHDPTRRIVEAGWSRWAASDPRVQALGLVLAWVASMLLAHGATRLLERHDTR